MFSGSLATSWRRGGQLGRTHVARRPRLSLTCNVMYWPVRTCYRVFWPLPHHRSGNPVHSLLQLHRCGVFSCPEASCWSCTAALLTQCLVAVGLQSTSGSMWLAAHHMHHMRSVVCCCGAVWVGKECLTCSSAHGLHVEVPPLPPPIALRSVLQTHGVLLLRLAWNTSETW